MTCLAPFLSNQRYKKVTGGATTHYIWQGSKVIAEHNGSTGAVLVDYLYSGRRMIANVASGSTQYFLSDRLSERLVLDTSGNVLGRMAHLPFGEDFAETGSQEKHHFASYERDGENGTDYAVNRQYASLVGRFGRPDPYRGSVSLKNPQSLNRYSYVGNDPVNSKDPLGLFCPPGCFDYDTGRCTCGDTDDNDSNGVPGGLSNDSMTKVDDWESETDNLDEGQLDQYDYCKAIAFGTSTMAGKLLVPTAQATKLAIKASHGDTNMAAMIAAIWGKESNFDPHPSGDSGPMQLTSWWRDNFPDLIVPGAYDGNVRANVFTGANILRELFSEHNGNWEQMAEWYNGNDKNLTPAQNKARREAYAADVMSALPQFQKFFDCMNKQLPHL